MGQRKIEFTGRQERYVHALLRSGRSGHSFSDVIRRATDEFIHKMIEANVIRDDDGGDKERVADDPNRT